MVAAPATNPSAKRSRRNRASRGAAAVVALAILVTGAAASADDAGVARGAYLAAAAGCDGCHTDSKNGGEPYAGGRVLSTTFGPIAAPNITPDPTAGIGYWSAGDFIRAMRFGIAPDGSHYVPAFPFQSFAGLTDSDLADLKAFLDGLKPVPQPIAGARDLALAPRARAAIGLAAGGAAASAPPSDNNDPAVARGRYLVVTVGHCGDCHTPLTWLGAPDGNRHLAGARGGLWGGGPNITPDSKTGIGSWSADDIASLLKDGGTPDGDFVGGAMAEIVRNTARLTDEDRRAIAAYLKTVPPKVFVKNN
jgi:mono/diheme cytochrome c family protein